MAPVMNLKKLPADVKDELHRELLRTHFSDYVRIATWLTEKGYKTSKSTLHRYAVQHMDEILNCGKDNQHTFAQLRLGALSIAAAISPEKDILTLTRTADDILKWALYGD